ncbi:MAG: penicillin acylase family protein [Pseudomonadota bacterium]
MNGADPVFEWGDFIPTEHYAQEYNPSKGFVSSANQHSADERYPYEMPGGRRTGHRQRGAGQTRRTDQPRWPPGGSADARGGNP